MGLFFILMFASGLAAYVARRILVRLNRRSEYKMVYGMIGFVITGGVVFVILFHTIINGSTNIGFGASAEEANQYLLSFKLPPEATDVNYRNNIWLGTIDVADFTVDEESFLTWAKANGWNMYQFITVDEKLKWTPEPNHLLNGVPSHSLEAYPVKYWEDEECKTIEIKNGYYTDTHKEENPDFGKSISYDLDHSRAYIQSSTR